MNQVKVISQSWMCLSCGGTITHTNYPEHEPEDPYSEGFNRKHFPEPQFFGLPAGQCPNCWAKGVRPAPMLEKATDLSSPVTVTVASDEELQARRVEQLDANGRVEYEQVGQHYELSVNRETGEVGSVLVEDYAPKLRQLTDEELETLELQRNQSLDALESVAVQEVTP